ncbi:MAG: FtsX-like permease family protein [Candidatus Odyssella sp.]|nr:FtsX-like permease family protein [Candidatus Odyssella sp.]
MRAIALAFTLARRELRGGIKGFRIVLACLALGVAAIAGIGSLSRAIEDGLRRDARKLLGGDLSFNLVHRPAGPAELAWLGKRGDVATVAELRAMAYVQGGAGAPGRDRLLVELKGVDDVYPLYGTIGVDGARPDVKSLTGLLAQREGHFGALVDPLLLERLGLKSGDRIKIGGLVLAIRGTLDHEPDRATRLFTLGPRVLISSAALRESGLLQPGSLVFYSHRLRLGGGTSAAAVMADAKKQFPEAGWRIRGTAEAAPGLDTFLARLTLYLTLVGLTALLVGGLGIASGVKAWLDGRTGTIATLKCLGAPASLIFRVYLIEVLALAGVAILVGLAAGTGLPLLLAGPLETLLPVKLEVSVYPLPLLLAGAFGLLTVLAFSLWALGAAREVPPAMLFRNTVAPVEARPRRAYLVATALCAAALAALAVLSAADRWMAGLFVAAVVGTFLLFQGGGAAITRTAKFASKRGTRSAVLRFALANLHRPGAPVGRIVLALGLGATVLVTIALLEGNLDRQLREQLPEKAPSFFFIDILPDQVADFDAAVKSVPGATGLERTPMLRGRIARINAVAVGEAAVAENVRWALDNERGLTFSATPPAGTELAAGKWWPVDYTGAPLISFDANLAQGMGLKVGDTLTFNILGREVTATIANLRRIHWRSLGINFTVIFAPGALEGAPHSHIASVHVPAAAETRLFTAVTDRLPNVSAIRVRDALDQAAGVFEQVGFAVRATAMVTLAAGLLVLAGAVAAGHRRRVYDAVVFKVLGATRRRILGAFLIEYGLIGIATAIFAAILGAVLAWAIVTQVMNAPFALLPETAAGTALVAAGIALAFGYFGIWRAMGQKAAPLLRNE